MLTIKTVLSQNIGNEIGIYEITTSCRSWSVLVLSHYIKILVMNSQFVGTILLNCSELLLSIRPGFPEAGEPPKFCKFQKLILSDRKKNPHNL